MNPKELTITLKKEDKTYKEKFLMYEDFSTSIDDPVIKNCINMAQASFKEQPDEVKIKITALL